MWIINLAILYQYKECLNTFGKHFKYNHNTLITINKYEIGYEWVYKEYESRVVIE